MSWKVNTWNLPGTLFLEARTVHPRTAPLSSQVCAPWWEADQEESQAAEWKTAPLLCLDSTYEADQEELQAQEGEEV